MFQENEKEWILEAINHLKHRKARPDLSRISLRMKRKYQMSFAQTKKLLESLIECGIVVKAVYKNNTSYRDVSQWKKGRLGGQILNSNKMLKRFIGAIEATETSKGTGVSAKDIEDFLASQGEEKCFLSGAALRDALENEIINGYLKKLSVGTQFHYTINTENINSASDILTQEDEDDNVDDNLGVRENSSHHEDSSFSLHSENLDAGPLLTNVMKAINETEQLERSGSSLLDIKEYLLIKGHEFTDDSFLLAFLEKHSRSGVLKKVVQDSVDFYSIPEKALDVNRDNSIDWTPTSDDIPRAFGLVSVKDEINSTVERPPAPPPHPMSFAPGAFNEYRSLSSAVPLRPPSKRKRIVKDHGPDFETEIPTRMKAKHTDNKESVYPTPTASPASEKSETTMEQSFKMEATKKRGRPKKPESPSGDHGQDDSSKQDGQSEPSDNEDDDDDSSLPSSHPDVFSWSPQKVADYFHKKGYVEEAKSMLANDLDGAALGLLRRSDVVGPPLGGLLKVRKLGVALKLFRDIRDLLYQGSADNYMDPYEERAFLRS